MSLKDYSTTAGSNTSSPPNGWPEGMTLANVNNTARQMMADIRQLAAEDTIASATTCDLGTKDATFLTVSGTTTITGFGTVSAGIYKFVKFSGALTLTHNATSLILLTAANRTTVAGDIGLYKSEGSGNWREYFYSAQGSYQPLDSDLTAIAALTTTAYGRAFLELADQAALKTAVGSTTTTAVGLVEKSTSGENLAGTDDTVFPSVAGVKEMIDTHAVSSSSVRVGTANGYGSTNTAIRRYANVIDNSGTDITYADSAANGSSFTINTTGMYSISSSESLAGQTFFGISKNSSQLTTAIQSITEADRLATSCVATVDVPGNCGVTVYLTAGDVIRPHGQGVVGTGAYPATVTMTVSRVG